MTTSSLVAGAAARRFTGARESRVRALAVAGVSGAATAVLVYRLLRSGGDEPGR